MISITTKTYDITGQAVFDPDHASDLRSNTRRVSRTATLDGGCEIVDQGYCDADRTLEIRKSQVSKDLGDRLWYLFQTYSLLRFSMPDGLYNGAIKRLEFKEGNLSMRVLIKERLA